MKPPNFESGFGDHGVVIPIVNRERMRIRCYLSLILSDVCAILVSFLLSNQAYIGSWSATHGVTMLSVLLPIYIWLGTINGAYSGSILADPRTGAIKAIQTFAFAAASLLIIAYSFKVGATFSRGVFWTGVFLATVLLLATRLIIGRMLLRILGESPFTTVVITDGLEWQPESRDIVLAAERIGFDPQTDNPHHFHQFAKLVASADRVVIACSDDRIVAWARVLKSMAVDGEIIARDVDRIGMIGIGRYQDRRTLVVSAGPLHLRDRSIKRAFDIVVSAVALTLLSPVYLAVAIAIRLESPGPILFRQQRIGRDNALFWMLKFRSMYADRSDAAASVLTSRSDHRVTRVGAFIRRNSLDELPQLVNVLLGDMSIEVVSPSWTDWRLS
jgi:hypothetical protein